MRIAFVCYEFFHGGGIRVYAQELVNRLAIAAELVCLRRADHLIAVSEFTRREILKHYPDIASECVTVIYSGVSPAMARNENRASLRRKFRLESGERVLLFAGRLEERKGLRYLLKAFQQLVEQ